MSHPFTTIKQLYDLAKNDVAGGFAWCGCFPIDTTLCYALLKSEFCIPDLPFDIVHFYDNDDHVPHYGDNFIRFDFVQRYSAIKDVADLYYTIRSLADNNGNAAVVYNGYNLPLKGRFPWGYIIKPGSRQVTFGLSEFNVGNSTIPLGDTQFNLKINSLHILRNICDVLSGAKGPRTDEELIQSVMKNLALHNINPIYYTVYVVNGKCFACADDVLAAWPWVEPFKRIGKNNIMDSFVRCEVGSNMSIKKCVLTNDQLAALQPDILSNLDDLIDEQNRLELQYLRHQDSIRFEDRKRVLDVFISRRVTSRSATCEQQSPNANTVENVTDSN